MKSIDIKSFLIGFLGCALIIACSRNTAKPVYAQIEKGGIGTYSIACGGHSNRKCLILDTRRGEVVRVIDPSRR